MVATVDEATKTINATVPYGTILTALAPTITITGVSVDPAGGSTQDFSSSVTYTVTAEDSTTVDYTAGVTVEPAPFMYWAGFSSNISRARIDGTDPGDLITGLSFAEHLFLDLTNNHIYWTDSGPDKIQRANLDGCGVTDILNTGAGPSGIDIDLAGGKIYWTEYNTKKVRRANLDGTGAEDLYTSTQSITGLALDLTNTKLYWCEYGNGKVGQANLDGSSPTYVVDAGDGGQLADIEVDVAGGKIYFSDRWNKKIRRANLDGSGAEDFITGITGVEGIALDLLSGEIYYGFYDVSMKIQKAKMSDGSGAIDVLLNSGRAWDLELGF